MSIPTLATLYGASPARTGSLPCPTLVERGASNGCVAWVSELELPQVVSALVADCYRSPGRSETLAN